jgi:hypothetical protein
LARFRSWWLKEEGVEVDSAVVDFNFLSITVILQRAIIVEHPNQSVIHTCFSKSGWVEKGDVYFLADLGIG